MGTFFQQFGVSKGNGTQFFRCKIRVAEHTLEVGDIDVRDISHHQDGLLDFAGIPDKVLDLAQSVIILLALLVDFHGLLKIVEHIVRRGRRMNDVLGGIDNALCQIARIAHDPLGLCCETGKEAAHAQHENFLFHDVSVFNW